MTGTKGREPVYCARVQWEGERVEQRYPTHGAAECRAVGRGVERFERAGIDEIVSRVALRRLGTLEDCARVVEFLATDLSDYVAGAVVPIDGGSTRWPS
jgi:NAD(P)-dependent dehydrogenase (short-subunit alcohol dehydrogenase family)